jgi:hypothetical protein
LGLPILFNTSEFEFGDATMGGLSILDVEKSTETQNIPVVSSGSQPRKVSPVENTPEETKKETSKEIRLEEETPEEDEPEEETPEEGKPEEETPEEDEPEDSPNEVLKDTRKNSPKGEPGDKDRDCPFRDSPIYRKVYVYPNYGDVENGWSGEILSHEGKDLSTLPRWPYLDIDARSRNESRAHYNIKSNNVQYATELLVREIMINPKSCLRTYDPEEATLFYVPYLPSVEHHIGSDRQMDYSTSPYGQAIMDITDKGDFAGWEKHFGLTSKYWKRRGGSDHILVFSEPMHGLYHPRSKRGNFHFIHSQKQLKPPIVISVELSTTFIRMYPKCAAKNILVPYPNTDGNWFNGAYEKQAEELRETANVTTVDSSVALPAERELAATSLSDARPVAQFYSAGNHGTCSKLRKAMQQDYRKCSSSFPALSKKLHATNYALGMRFSTFCPCPGGDSPSAKRHYDALIAECIPIILSSDFVWPFTNEFDPDIGLDPSEFSLRLKAQDYDTALLNSTTCQPIDESRPGFQVYLESISVEEIQRVREGVEKARKLYAWYKYDSDLPENPLREGILPDGGTAHEIVKMLADRAAGAKWPACEEELTHDHGPDARQFNC